MVTDWLHPRFSACLHHDVGVGATLRTGLHHSEGVPTRLGTILATKISRYTATALTLRPSTRLARLSHYTKRIGLAHTHLDLLLALLAAAALCFSCFTYGCIWLALLALLASVALCLSGFTCGRFWLGCLAGLALLAIAVLRRSGFTCRHLWLDLAAESAFDRSFLLRGCGCCA